jgi:hypothetical protein
MHPGVSLVPLPSPLHTSSQGLYLPGLLLVSAPGSQHLAQSQCLVEASQRQVEGRRGRRRAGGPALPSLGHCSFRVKKQSRASVEQSCCPVSHIKPDVCCLLLLTDSAHKNQQAGRGSAQAPHGEWLISSLGVEGLVPPIPLPGPSPVSPLCRSSGKYNLRHPRSKCPAQLPRAWGLVLHLLWFLSQQ